MSDSLQPHDCSTPGLPVHHLLPEFVQTHVHQVDDAIQPAHPVIPFSSCLQSFPALGSFPVSQFFTSGGRSIGASASASVFPMNIQTWFPLGLSGLISLQSKGLSRVLFNTWLMSYNGPIKYHICFVSSFVHPPVPHGHLAPMIQKERKKEREKEWLMHGCKIVR